MSAEIRTSPDLAAGIPKPLFKSFSTATFGVFAASADASDS